MWQLLCEELAVRELVATFQELHARTEGDVRHDLMELLCGFQEEDLIERVETP